MSVVASGLARANRGAASRNHTRNGVILALACVAQFMVILDVSIVNVALPSIQRDLHFTPGGLQWVVNAYALTFAGFLMLGGRAADLYGRRKIFILGLSLFTLASIVGGFSQGTAMLTAARAAQGLGGAVLSPATLTLLITTFPEGPARSRALGIWSAVAGGGAAAGALFGGILTQYLSWRWILFINVPIGVVVTLGAIAFLSEGRRNLGSRSLDLPGAITVTGGMALLVYGIVQTSSNGWSSGRTIGLLVGAVALLVAFLVIEARFAESPLVPLSIFRLRTVSSANVVMLILGVGFLVSFYFESLFMQNVLGYDALKTGLLFLPFVAAIAFGSQFSARVVDRIGPRPLLVVGLVISAGGFYWLSHFTATSTFVGNLLGPGMLMTLGIGLCFTPLATASTSGVSPSQSGLASALLNTSRQVGGSIGLAAIATVAVDRTTSLLAHSNHSHSAMAVALTAGYSRAFVVGAATTLVAAIAALAVPALRRAVAAKLVNAEDAHLGALVLALTSRLIETADGKHPALVAAAAKLVPDDGGSDHERANQAAREVLRPMARALLATPSAESP
ncbi:MAG: MFS transporter [Acidimicrobiales bacterium]